MGEVRRVSLVFFYQHLSALIPEYLIISMDQSANKKPMEPMMMTMKMATPAQDTAALQQG